MKRTRGSSDNDTDTQTHPDNGQGIKDITEGMNATIWEKRLTVLRGSLAHPVTLWTWKKWRRATWTGGPTHSPPSMQGRGVREGAESAQTTLSSPCRGQRRNTQRKAKPEGRDGRTI